jgi:hypothetical protein
VAVYFLTFASSNLKRSSKRILAQARKMNVYDHVIGYDEFSLDPGFRAKFKDYLNFSVRGFGYWSWKPQIIRQTLSKMSEGDVLQYTDAGCHLNFSGRWRLLEYLKLTSNTPNGILAFQAKPPEKPFHFDQRDLPLLTDNMWVKGDLLDYLNVRNEKQICMTPTIGAGIIFIRKCPESVKIIDHWISVFHDDFSLINDENSESLNLPGFVEHRHDQAIFSILCKINNVQTLSAFEYWYPKVNSNKRADWKALKNYPIHAKRDKGSMLTKAIRFFRGILML